MAIPPQAISSVSPIFDSPSSSTCCTLHIKNWPYDLDEMQLFQLFRSWHPIGVRIPKRKEGRSKGFGFVDFSSVELAEAARASVDQTCVRQRIITVEFTREKPPELRGHVTSLPQRDLVFSQKSYFTQSPPHAPETHSVKQTESFNLPPRLADVPEISFAGSKKTQADTRFANQSDPVTSSPGGPYVVLVTGMLGSGKSTLINVIANYFLNGTLQDTKTVIPTKHISVVSETAPSNSAKATNFPSYTFTRNNEKFIFIETPGVLDGQQANQNIVDSILFSIENRHPCCIVWVANGTTDRLSYPAEKAFSCFLNILPHAVLVLTNTHQSSCKFDYQSCSWIPNLQVGFMDNSAFPVCRDTWTPADKIAHQKNWDESLKTVQSLLNIIRFLKKATPCLFSDARGKESHQISFLLDVEQQTGNANRQVDIPKSTSPETTGDPHSK